MTDRSRELVRTLREAADHMDGCAGSSAEEARRCFHEAYTRVIGARNHLMRARTHERSADAPPAREAEGGRLQLERLNALLSLMTSFDFPLAGFHPERLDAARQEIRSLLAETGEAGPDDAAQAGASQM